MLKTSLLFWQGSALGPQTFKMNVCGSIVVAFICAIVFRFSGSTRKMLLTNSLQVHDGPPNHSMLWNWRLTSPLSERVEDVEVDMRSELALATKKTQLYTAKIIQIDCLVWIGSRSADFSRVVHRRWQAHIVFPKVVITKMQCFYKYELENRATALGEGSSGCAARVSTSKRLQLFEEFGAVVCVKCGGNTDALKCVIIISTTILRT